LLWVTSENSPSVGEAAAAAAAANEVEARGRGAKKRRSEEVIKLTKALLGARATPRYSDIRTGTVGRAGFNFYKLKKSLA
jgi:hypothetical protein